MRNSNFKLLWRGDPEPTACAILKVVHLRTMAAFEGACSHLLAWWQTADLDSPL